MKYQPIENYGVIGDLNTIGLVGLNGSIDFLCFPDFDSPSIFASILDAEKGGFFKISPKKGDVKNKQLYLPDTNVLLTHFLSSEGIGEITDFMPVEALYEGNVVIRRVNIERGCMTFCMHCCPRFNYGRTQHQVEHNGREIIFREEAPEGLAIRLVSSVPLELKGKDGYAEFTLREGEIADFTLEMLTDVNTPEERCGDFITEKLFETINYWKDWVAKSTYRGRWAEVVHRSALSLKLMTSYKYGSIVAAPTFSLPEEIGGERNWDYRFTWIRDASFTIYSLLRLGYKKEAQEFIKWVEKECEDIGETGALHLMYSISGESKLEEFELPHFEGYRQSGPVRVGNAAHEQVQLDIYGELIDSVYLYDKYVEPISYQFWLNLSQQVNWVCNNWHLEDEGIWEVRGGKRKFLYSRLLCWVALDRAVKIGHAHSFPLNENWIKERDKIFHSIHENFWNEELQAFVQFEGAHTVDASTLLMPILRFISPTDPLWLSTLERIEKELVSASMVYRYRPDEEIEGLTGGEGTFSMCTFWYVECLALSGQLQKARLVFEKMLGHANHLGLYAEQLGLQGEHLGNFPQAFTHLGLISAAMSLNDRLNDERTNQRDYHPIKK